jgi:hypothetical protein
MLTPNPRHAPSFGVALVTPGSLARFLEGYPAAPGL